MGSKGRTVLAAVIAGLVAAGPYAAAAPGLRLSLVRGPNKPEVGRGVPVVVGLTGGGRPRTGAKVDVWIARGYARRSFPARAFAPGRYRATVVFPQAGSWVLGARAAGVRARFGSVRVRRRATALTFAWPTSVDVVSNRSLLLAENGNGRVLRLDPVTGKTAALATVDRAYAVVRAPSGAVYLSAGTSLLRLDDAGGSTRVAEGTSDIGPVAVAANGDVYYATETGAFKLVDGAGTPVPVATHLSGPHGLAVTADGGLLVSDTGNGRVLRVDLKTGHVETWSNLGDPLGMNIAPDGTVYVVDASTNRVVHLTIDGRRLGTIQRVFADPYAVSAAADGSLYVVDTSPRGRLYRVGRHGAITVVSR
jgi:streptogramin lyase